MHVVICGGGVIGACTGYFLARRGIDVTVVERSAVASSASGKAGGFLALDWCAGSPLDALARRSFALHASLLQDIDGDWGYQRMTAYSGLVVPDRDRRRHVAAELDWLSDGVIIAARLSTTETTAIVHPRSFTLAIMHAAQQHGARLRHGQVTGSPAAGTRSWGSTSTARLSGQTQSSSQWGPGLCAPRNGCSCRRYSGRKAPASSTTPARRCRPRPSFLTIRMTSGNVVTVEVFPRADGSTHVTAFSGQDPLPMDPADVKPDPAAIDRLQAICERLSPAFRADRIIARQACFRPVTQDGLPLIGQVPGSEGAYIATGHSVWGILNAPATGEAMAELVADGVAKTTDLAPFDPARLRPLDPASIRLA